MTTISQTTPAPRPPLATPARRRSLWTGLVASVGAVATAAAGWALIPGGGNLPEPPFVGKTWQLRVGETPNGDGTYKVCRAFWPVGVPASDANGLGGAGCETSPVDAPEGFITQLLHSVETETGMVLLVDLTKRPVSRVVIETDDGQAFEVIPFTMPRSGEQLVAVELSRTAKTVSVKTLDHSGNVTEERELDDLKTY